MSVNRNYKDTVFRRLFSIKKNQKLQKNFYILGNSIVYSINGRCVRKKMTINKKYKDTVFRMLFNNPKAALELYNAIFGADYKDWSAVKINTLANILFMGLKNDVSFIIYDTLALIEHQSLS